MGRFLSRLSRHAKPALRLFACELAGVLLFRQVCALPGFTSTSSHFTTCFTSTRGSLPASLPAWCSSARCVLCLALLVLVVTLLLALLVQEARCLRALRACCSSARGLLCLLYWYKSTNTDTGGAACQGDDSSDAATYADVC
jgi:hypothetical protein